MGRKFRIYCVEVSNDGSEFKLVFEMDGKVVEEKDELWCFDDVLTCSYDFFRENLENYKFDSRFDRCEVNIGYKW